MADTHQLSGISYEIHQELDAPTNPTTGSIFYWLESNAGKLNNEISTFYSYISGDYTPQLGHDEKDILKALYFENYYKTKARNTLAGLDNSKGVLSVKNDISSMSFTNKKDVARVWTDMAKEAQSESDRLANLWKHNRSGPRDPSMSWSGHWE
jgi:hypothetical protein